MIIEIPPDEPPSTATVHELPIKPPIVDTGKVLTVVPGMKCWHKRFTIDETLDTVECRDCGEKLNPMYALRTLARQETQYHEYHARYQDEMKRLTERSRTKCQHCGQMTRISHK